MESQKKKKGGGGNKKGLEQLSKEIMAEILINLMNTINFNQENHENHIEADWNQISEKETILNVAKQKDIFYIHIITNIRTKTYFLSETMHIRRQCNDIFKVLIEKSIKL